MNYNIYGQPHKFLVRLGIIPTLNPFYFSSLLPWHKYSTQALDILNSSQVFPVF